MLYRARSRRVLNRVLIAAKASIVHVISTTSRQHDSPRLSPPPQHTAEKQRERKSKRKSRRGVKGGEAGDDGGDSGGKKKILVAEPGASARVSSYVDLSNPSERGKDELEEL